MTPNDIAEHFHTSRQAISKHLRILTECNLVSSEPRGRTIFYSLEVKKMQEIDQWIAQFRQYWENKFDQLDLLLQNLNNNAKTTI